MFLRNALCAAAGLALWSGCAAAGTTFTPARGNSVPQSGVRARLAVPVMNASGCSSSVVYVSSYQMGVEIYDQAGQNQTACGNISGFTNPQGVFVDAKANVWVADQAQGKVFEFKPGGGSPIKTLSDTGNNPFVVAVDNKSGTVYVTDSQNGNVEVFAKGANNPTAMLTESASLGEFFDAVDGKGNVYVTYLNVDGKGHIDEWLKGKGSPVDLGITLNAPGGIQTTKTGALAVCDQFPAVCGEFKPHSTMMTNLFAQSDGDAYGIALNKSETRAYVSDVGTGNVNEWKYPGPDSSSLDTIVVTSGAENVAAGPAAPEGKPYSK